jgi:hypothetical protein
MAAAFGPVFGPVFGLVFGPVFGPVLGVFFAIFGGDRNFPCQTLKIRNVSLVVMGLLWSL